MRQEAYSGGGRQMAGGKGPAAGSYARSKPAYASSTSYSTYASSGMQGYQSPALSARDDQKMMAKLYRQMGAL